MPEVHFERRFKPFVEEVLPEIAVGSTALVAHPVGSKVCPYAVDGPVTLCVGPEGGFTEYEVEKIAEVGCEPVTIGDRILRTEFALAALFGRLFV